jgi:hypothetical protein
MTLQNTDFDFWKARHILGEKMDKMDLDFIDNSIICFLNQETKEDYVYKTKEHIRAMDEKEIKEILYWAIQEIKDLKISARELRDLKNALGIINNIRRS